MNAVYNQTVLHPLGLGLTLLAGVLLWSLPWSRIPAPLIFASFLIPAQQRIDIASLDLTMLRLLVLIGLLRILLRRDAPRWELTPYDRLFFAYLAANALAFILLRQTSAAVFNRLAHAGTLFGLYALARVAVRDLNDIDRLVRLFGMTIFLLAGFMLIEVITRRNLFAMFGGVPPAPVLRDGFLRCQGPFGNSIMAGTYAAALAPLLLARWPQGRGARRTALAALAAIGLVAVLSNSSGAILTLAAGLAALAFWPLRRCVRPLRWTVLGLAVITHFFFVQPLWALFTRVHVFSASTGYHRFRLVDEFVRRSGEWIFFGSDNLHTWGPAWMNLADVTNQFVFEGVMGGLLGLLLFGALLARGFSTIGRALRAIHGDPTAGLLLWGLGASLFAHTIAFLGATYFGTITVLWTLTLACLAAVGAMAAETEAAARPASIATRLHP